MSTPFDELIERIRRVGYHNHREQEHSDLISRGILRDLLLGCDVLKSDLDAGVVRSWLNIKTRGGRGRKIDLLVGEPLPDDPPKTTHGKTRQRPKPDLRRARICIEHKSVITAHRNKTTRYDDLEKLRDTMHSVQPEAVLVATVLVGTATRVLNVPDRVKNLYKRKREEFESKVRPRLSTGDQTLWQEFEDAISENDPDDPKKTVDRFRELGTRQPGHTHAEAFDYLMLVPVQVDNVNPPFLPRPSQLGIDVDSEYESMLSHICKAYRMRWHS
jgi:hypothetical protein